MRYLHSKDQSITEFTQEDELWSKLQRIFYGGFSVASLGFTAMAFYTRDRTVRLTFRQAVFYVTVIVSCSNVLGFRASEIYY